MSKALHNVTPGNPLSTSLLPSAACSLLQPEGRICWVLSCCCDFTFDLFSTHSGFPLGKLIHSSRPRSNTHLGESLPCPSPTEPGQDSIVLSAFLLNLSLRVHARTQRPGRPQSSGRGDTVLKNLSSFPQKHFLLLRLFAHVVRNLEHSDIPR